MGETQAKQATMMPLSTVGGSQLCGPSPSGGAELHREVRRFRGCEGGRAAASARAIGQMGKIGRVLFVSRLLFCWFRCYGVMCIMNAPV